MDEYELIQRFRGSCPGPDPRARAAARLLLVGQIERETARRPRRRPGMRIRWPASAAAVAGALVAAWVLVLAPLLGNNGGTSTAAARVLGAAARTAAAQPARVLQPGEYAYTRSEGAYFDEQDRQGRTWGALVRTTREIWVASDGSGRIKQQSDPPTFLAPDDRARWQAAGSPPLTELSSGETYDRHFAPGGLTTPLDLDGLSQEQLLRLVGDPAALAAAIRNIAERSSNPLGYEMLTIVGDLLAESAAPPQLRASLYRVAAAIPSIELIGRVEDTLGRSGIAVAASGPFQRLELIFDPATSALLAREEVLVRSIPDTAAPPGTPVAYTLYLQSGIVRSLNRHS